MTENSHVDGVLASLAAVERHVRSEYADDLEATLATVAAEAGYAVMAEPGVINVLSGIDAIADLYGGARGVVSPQASRMVTQIATDWYVFFENFPTRVHVASSEWRTTHSATFVPTRQDRIVGEMLWERQAGAPGEQGAEARSEQAGKIRSLRLHDRMLSALCQGDISALQPILDAEALWAERDYLVQDGSPKMLEERGAGKVLGHLRRWQEAFAPERVSILNRVATDWYVFAEELWVVRPKAGGGERRQYRKAAIYPITPSGQIQAALGYGTDLEAAGPLTDRTLGAAFHERLDLGPEPDQSLAGG